MKKYNLFLVAVIILLIGFTACSKKGGDKLIGKWKLDKVEEMEKMNIKLDVIYEFSKDKLSFQITMDGKQQPKQEGSYTIKSDDGTNLVIEAFKKETNEKAEIKLRVDGNRLTMIGGPDGKESNFTRL